MASLSDKQRVRSVLVSLTMLPFLAVSCGTEDQRDEDTEGPADGAGGDGPGPGPGGAGGGNTQSYEPLYGEEGTAPDNLRLVFRAIEIPGVNSATDMAFLPPGDDLGKSSFLLLSRNNFIHWIDLEEGEATVRQSWDFDDGGYIGEACAPTNILLDPDFEENGFIFVTKCAEVETTQLLRFRWDADKGLSERRVIFETTLPTSDNGWHRMGSIGWESDDVLWMLVGDHDDGLPNPNSQDVTNPLGALLRIIPNREPSGSGHEYPEGNFIDQPDAPDQIHPAIFAYGLRSPWRGTRDARGRVWIGDVGLGTFEEVNLATEVGQNFGWGDHNGPCEADCEGVVDPFLAYDRDPDHPYLQEEPLAGGSDQRAIWVGEIYEDPTVDRYERLLDGVVPFGDLFVGFVRGITLIGGDTPPEDRPIGVLHNVTSWKVAPDGYVYAVDLFGTIHVALLDYIPAD